MVPQAPEANALTRGTLHDKPTQSLTMSAFSSSTLSAPDSGVRKIMLKASMGQALTDRELKRLAARQRAEEQTVGSGGQIAGGVGITTPTKTSGMQPQSMSPVQRARSEVDAIPGNTPEARNARIASAKNSGTFNLLQQDYNARNAGRMQMDENGNISPVAKAPPAGVAPATRTIAPTPATPSAPRDKSGTIRYQTPDGSESVQFVRPGVTRDPVTTVDGNRARRAPFGNTSSPAVQPRQLADAPAGPAAAKPKEDVSAMTITERVPLNPQRVYAQRDAILAERETQRAKGAALWETAKRSPAAARRHAAKLEAEAARMIKTRSL